MSWFLRDYMDDPLFFGRVFDPATLTIIGTAATAASAGTAGYAASRSNKPNLEPKLAMPDPADQETKRREEERLRATRGRESTILGDDDTMADTAYSNSSLGL